MIVSAVGLIFSSGSLGAANTRGAPAASAARVAALAVFLLLAERAKRIKADAALNAWLFETTRRITKAALRLEARRKRREQEVAMTHRIARSEEEDLWPQLAGDLDALVDKLRSSD